MWKSVAVSLDVARGDLCTAILEGLYCGEKGKMVTVEVGMYK